MNRLLLLVVIYICLLFTICIIPAPFRMTKEFFSNQNFSLKLLNSDIKQAAESSPVQGIEESIYWWSRSFQSAFSLVYELKVYFEGQVTVEYPISYDFQIRYDNYASTILSDNEWNSKAISITNGFALLINIPANSLSGSRSSIVKSASSDQFPDHDFNYIQWLLNFNIYLTVSNISYQIAGVEYNLNQNIEMTAFSNVEYFQYYRPNIDDFLKEKLNII